MERTANLVQFWAWLPAFRAVAEAQSMAVASRALRLTPSALSRTVRLLEDAVGQPLFIREGRKLRLTRAGDALLLSVRRAMRSIDDGVAASHGGIWRGALTIASPPWFADRFVVPTLPLLRADNAEVVPVLRSAELASPVAALQSGEIDIAIVSAAPASAHVRARLLPPLAVAEFAADAAPTGHAGVVGLDDIARLSASQARVDLDVAAATCRGGGLRVTLPVVLAGGLRRVGPAQRGTLEMWALLREEPGWAGTVVDKIEAEMGAAARCA